MTDSFPGETTWRILDVTNDLTVTEVNMGASFTMFKTSICLSLLSNCYIFTITDSWGDGLIGGGYYSLEVDGELYGESYTYEVSHQFGNCEYSPPPSATLSLSPSATPSLSPSATPSLSPSPTPPSPSDCSFGENEVTVEVMTDSFPENTAWSIFSLLNEEDVVSVEFGDLTQSNTLYTESLCVSFADCYIFVILDTLAGGYYSLSVDGEVLYQNDFTLSASLYSHPFGLCA